MNIDLPDEEETYTRGYKQEPRKQFSFSTFVEKLPFILEVILGSLAGFILLVTLIVLIVNKGNLGGHYRKTDPEPQQVIKKSNRTDEKVSAYSQIGQMRLCTKAQDDDMAGNVLVLEPWFSYPQDDTEFYEELSQKDRQIKSLITEYFTAHTKQELLDNGEQNIKAELKELINGQLVLGKIKDIYFKEYIYFD